MSYFFQRPDWFDETRFWKRFWTWVVWLLLAAIPAFWAWLWMQKDWEW